MDTKSSPSFWWLKTSSVQLEEAVAGDNITTNSKFDVDISSSLAEFLEKEKSADKETYSDADIASIIDEINRVAAQSPLGPYDKEANERSVEEIMREAEKIFQESSKSFEQLSARSRTSQNITELNSISSKNSTPTPKSVSPLPIDDQMDRSVNESDAEDSYSDDFSNASKTELQVPSDKMSNSKAEVQKNHQSYFGVESHETKETLGEVEATNTEQLASVPDSPKRVHNDETFGVANADIPSEQRLSLMWKEDVFEKDETIRILELDNATLRMEIQSIKVINVQLHDKKQIGTHNKNKYSV